MQKSNPLFALIVFVLIAHAFVGSFVTRAEEQSAPPPVGSDVPETSESMPSADLPSDVAGSEIPETMPSPEVAPEQSSEVAKESTPTPVPVTKASSESVEVYDPRVPLYQQLHPRWAMDASFSLKPFKGQLPGASASNVTGSRAVTLRVEYQPEFFKRFGVLGFGPSLGVYPLVPTNAQTSNVFALWSLGAQVRYQAKFLRNQFVVPWGGYAIESFRYGLKSGTKGSLQLSGAFFGGAVLLNGLDPSMAGDFYSDHGVKRTYAFAEIRALRGSSGSVRLSESSVFFGLRFEL
jgi:hypothetical protein